MSGRVTSPAIIPYLGNHRRKAYAAATLSLALVAPLLVSLSLTFGHGCVDRYAQAWASWPYWRVLGRSAAFAGQAAMWAVLFGWPLARQAERLVPRWRVLLLCLTGLPLFVPTSLIASGWIMALGRDGVVTRWLFGSDPPVTIYDMSVAAAALGLRYIALAAIPLVYQMQAISHRAAIDRAWQLPPLRRWWSLEVPGLAKGVITGAAIVFMFAINDHIMAGMLLISTYGNDVLVAFNALMDQRAAMALSTPVLAMGVVAAMVIAGRIVHTSAIDDSPPPPAWRRMRRAWLWAMCAAIVIMLAIGVPLAGLVVRARTFAAVGEAIGSARNEIITTTWLALTAGAVCMVIGWLLADGWRTTTLPGRMAMTAVAMIILLAPPATVALAIDRVFGFAWLVALRDTPVPLLAAYAVRFSPVAMLLLLTTTDRRTRMAHRMARGHGVAGWALLWHIVLRPRLASLIATAGVCTLLAAAELDMSVMLAPPGRTTLGVRLYTMIHTAPDPMVSALCIAVLAATAIVMMLVALACTLLDRREAAERV